MGVLNFATVDSSGKPQVRCISAIHYEPDAIYFYTARGKNFCHELIADDCIECGTCKAGCPQDAIDEGSPYHIRPDNGLHCGRCYENWPVQAIERL